MIEKVKVKRESGVKSVGKALIILESFTPDQPCLSLNDLSKKTGFYKSTILRQIDTLASRGFVVREPETERYRLGPKIYLLGQIFINSSNLLSSVRPILKEVVHELQETAGIFVVDGTKRLCLTLEHSPHFIRATFEAGNRLPLHAGASGKVLLAFSEDSLLDQIFAGAQPEKFTKKTIVDRNKLRTELDQIKKQGYAISLGERIPSAATVSVPVFGPDGSIACSLSTSGPIGRFRKNSLPSIIKVLTDAGIKISKESGYLGEYWQKK